MSLLNDKIKEDLKKMFLAMDKEIHLKFFTQEMECLYCKETHSLLDEVSGLSDKIKLEIFDFQKDEAVAKEYKIDKIPALVVMDEKDRGIRFFGIPSGYEFSSLINTMMMVSTGRLNLKKSTMEVLDYIKRPVHLQVFVSPTCPYCPPAVILAHQMAYYSDYVTADMVEASEFQHLAIRYQVQGVPRTVINETVFMEGAAPEDMLLEKIKSAL